MVPPLPTAVQIHGHTARSQKLLHGHIGHDHGVPGGILCHLALRRGKTGLHDQTQCLIEHYTELCLKLMSSFPVRYGQVSHE